MAPTRAPRITRGTLICQTIAVSTDGTDRAGCQGNRTRSASAIVGGERSAGPPDTPTITGTASAATAKVSGRPGLTRPSVVAGARSGSAGAAVSEAVAGTAAVAGGCNGSGTSAARSGTAAVTRRPC